MEWVVSTACLHSANASLATFSVAAGSAAEDTPVAADPTEVDFGRLVYRVPSRMVLLKKQWMPKDGITTLLNLVVKVYRSESVCGSSRARLALTKSRLNGLADDEIVKLGVEGDPEGVIIH